MAHAAAGVVGRLVNVPVALVVLLLPPLRCGLSSTGLMTRLVTMDADQPGYREGHR